MTDHHEDERHPVSQWQREVANGETLLGYAAWVKRRLTAHPNAPELWHYLDKIEADTDRAIQAMEGDEMSAAALGIEVHKNIGRALKMLEDVPDWRTLCRNRIDDNARRCLIEIFRLPEADVETAIKERGRA